MGEITKEIIGKADGVASEVYKDAVRPIVKPVGEVLSFIPRTIRLWLSGWEKWLINGEASVKLTAETIENKIKQVPIEKIVEPEPYVAIPAIQQLAYCQDNTDLRNLYANLLVSSMNVDTKWDVHPAFVDIIKQLSPDEARIINSVGNFKNNCLPLVDVKGVVKNESKPGRGHQLLITNFTTTGFHVIEKKENICKYVDNLIRLNLFEIPPAYHLVDDNLYQPVERHPVLERMVKPYRSSYDISYHHKIWVISNLGLSFKRICCSL